MAQIIDENANVNEGLDQYLDNIGITKAGLNYHTLSIIGCQSSGKSTLLNALFHTKFATMNESTGRQQTTKGIHAAFNDQNVLIFDIEGSDSRERGDADALFERKAALFGLALSEVVMVNMWENDIGRYNASSIPLLRTVFEVNLQLFASSQEAKCHLLFVIRDATQKDEIIKDQVRRDLDLIWRGLVLPPNLQNKKFEDFFIFHFFSLPHLRLKPDEFKESAAKLASKFTNPEDPDFFFSQPMGKLIPGDGLGQYIHSVWDAISENRELNLPSQRKTLSNFRCEEFMNQALEEFQKSLDEEVKKEVGEKPFFGFHDACEKIVDKAIETYNASAGKYVKEIVVEKRNTMKDKMSETLEPLYTSNCELFVKQKNAEFLEQINGMSNILEEAENLEKQAIESKEKTLEDINKFVEESKVSDFPWKYELNDLPEKLAKTIEAKLDKAQKEMESRVYGKRSPEYKAKINQILDEAPADMWEKMRAEMNKEIEETKDEINQILKKSTISRVANEKIVSMFYKATVSQVNTATEFVPQKMNMKFEEKFLQDENHNSRKWSPEDDIPQQFEEAREAGMNVLKMFTNCQLREPGTAIPPKDILTQQMITPIKAQAIESEYNEAIEKNYYTAVQIKESMIVRNDVPIWMWIIIAITGYQKLVAAVKHPFAAMFVFAAVGLVFYLYKLGKLTKFIKYIKDFITKTLSLIIKILKSNTNELELPQSIKENAKKSATLDKEAIIKGIDAKENNEDAVELPSLDSSSDLQRSTSTSSINSQDSLNSPEKPRKKRTRKPHKDYGTMQPGQFESFRSQLKAGNI